LQDGERGAQFVRDLCVPDADILGHALQAVCHAVEIRDQQRGFALCLGHGLDAGGKVAHRDLSRGMADRAQRSDDPPRQPHRNAQRQQQPEQADAQRNAHVQPRRVSHPCRCRGDDPPALEHGIDPIEGGGADDGCHHAKTRHGHP
jgi:hypothetical protein